MAATLAGTVFVRDPENNQQWVELPVGSTPEARLGALVTNPAAWVDGKLPPAAKKKAATSDPDSGETGSGNDGGADSSGDDSSTPDATLPDPDEVDDSEDTKPAAAKKTVAKRPARGRTAAVEGDGGQ